MKVIDTEIADAKILVPDVFNDARGYFVETYNDERFQALGITTKFVQDNESCSMRGVVRGLHWQAAPYTQAKLVRVIRGAVWDVAVDIRKGSATFGKFEAALLTAENHHQFYVPQGFAHGFAVLEDHTVFAYKCDNFYHPEAECGLLWNDPALNLPWPELMMDPILSPKDLKHPTLAGITPWEAC